jgi:hypothetical protein
MVAQLKKKIWSPSLQRLKAVEKRKIKRRGIGTPDAAAKHEKVQLIKVTQMLSRKLIKAHSQFHN